MKILNFMFLWYTLQGTAWANSNETVYGNVGSKLKSGDVTLEMIPQMIFNVTNYLLGISATIAVLVIIYGAFQLSIGSVSQDKDKGKRLVTGAIIGFVLSMGAWAIISLLINNLG